MRVCGALRASLASEAKRSFATSAFPNASTHPSHPSLRATVTKSSGSAAS